ncbi:hypothetical protein OIDMADRAFT_141698 [Oidiodendron maius Zn]|uniref:Uncharacterized protein n=1 Tax=Oidiodendron maius (strain Zn) TaxID=913774 RepID=A0A0C3HV10_OIDMZ|nr:hypothetical protein OIDMADRAFT_141698 [Oidiodendron maius Zn]
MGKSLRCNRAEVQPSALSSTSPGSSPFSRRILSMQCSPAAAPRPACLALSSRTEHGRVHEAAGPAPGRRATACRLHRQISQWQSPRPLILDEDLGIQGRLQRLRRRLQRLVPAQEEAERGLPAIQPTLQGRQHKLNNSPLVYAGRPR